MKQLVLIVLVLSLTFVALSALKVGEVAPTFSLKSYDGKSFDLKDLLKTNKLTVLMFVSTECPVSNAYNERMQKLHETYSKKGIAVVGINSNKAEDVERIAEHAKEHKFTFPILKDERNKVANLYDAQVTPEVFVIKPALRKLGVDFPTYIANDSTDEVFMINLSPEWSGALPTSFLYDQHGKLAEMMVGKRTYDQFRQKVRKLLRQ